MTDRLNHTQQRALRFLQAAGMAFQEEIASEVDVTPRHVRRVIKALRKNGHGVSRKVIDGKRAYVLAEEERYPLHAGVKLSERQTLALVVAIEAARPSLEATPFATDIREALDTLLTEAQGIMTFEPDQVTRQFHFQGAPSADIDPEVFTTVRRAIVEQHRLSIDYFTASRQKWSRGRRIDPLALSCVNGAWLCAAWCHRSDDFRDFNLVDIATCTRVGETFQQPEAFEAADHFGGRFGALAGEEPQRVRLRLDPKTVAYFRRKQYHPTQELGPIAEDGSAEVTFQVQELRSVAAFVRSWGPKLEVVEPVELRETIRRDATALADRYSALGDAEA